MGTIESGEAREASGLTTRLIVAYVESEGGRVAVRELLERCGLEGREAELCDENAWFPDLVRVGLLEAAAEVLGDPLAARHMGESALDLNVAHGLKVALRALGSPSLLYKNVARANAKFNRAHEMTLLELGDTHARIENRPRDGTPYHVCDCDYNIGLLAQAPALFGEPAARISHSECIGRGADACVFELEWTNPRKRTRRLIAVGTLAAASVAAATLLAPWLLPALSAAIAATVAVLVVAAIAAARRRTRSLEREVSQQREATGRLMESLEDLVSALRLEDVLAKITHNAQDAVGGTQFALLLEDSAGVRCRSSSGLPSDVTAALERWAGESPALAEEPVLLDDFEGAEPLAALRDHPALPLGSLCAAPLVYRDRHLGALVALAGGREGFLPRDVALLQSYASQAAIALTNARLYEAQQALATRDALTGLLNHREFHETVDAELERCRRYGGALSVILLDLDEFKLVNDESGHAAGDRVLRAVAHELQGACRMTDRAFRVGGDELALVLPETGQEGAIPVAGRARQRLSEVEPRITVSYGIASWPESGPSKDALLARADAELYAMKHDRRAHAEPRADGVRDPYRERHQQQVETATRLAELESTFMSTIAVLSDALEAKDAYTAEHAREVAELAERVGTRLGLSGEELRTVRYAALLHDIGKIGIDGEIIRKPGPLTPAEFEEMKRHPAMGAQMLERIPFFAEVHPVVRSSHERWDGRGYPDGLREEQIPLGARIINACDALDAMTSPRPYREILPIELAIAEVREQAGGQFDPSVAEALVAIVEGAQAGTLAQ